MTMYGSYDLYKLGSPEDMEMPPGNGQCVCCGKEISSEYGGLCSTCQDMVDVLETYPQVAELVRAVRGHTCGSQYAFASADLIQALEHFPTKEMVRG